MYAIDAIAYIRDIHDIDDTDDTDDIDRQTDHVTCITGSIVTSPSTQFSTPLKIKEAFTTRSLNSAEDNLLIEVIEVFSAFITFAVPKALKI